MKKFKKLKGFTLIELIIVMAIFSVVMFSALQLITPVGKLFSSTSQYEGARSVLDNIKRYFDGTIRYADKAFLCWEDVSNRDSEVAKFYEKYYKDNIYTNDSKNDYIYVLQFDNTQYDTDTSKVVTLYQYKMNYTETTINGSKVQVPSGYNSTPTVSNPINESLFGDYSVQFYLGQYEYKNGNKIPDGTPPIAFSASDFCMSCDLYKNTSTGMESIQQITSISVNFININEASNLTKPVVTGTDVSGVVTGSYVGGVDMFKFIDSNPSGGHNYKDNFFIIYTVPNKK